MEETKDCCQELSEEQKINSMRLHLKDAGACVMSLKKEVAQRETDGVEDMGEIMANLILCYRHLEDASMRLGKVLQAKAGGKSVYDGKEDKTVCGSPK